MKITKKFVLLFFFLFSATLANAQYARQTSFDDRQICDENKGVWREFGNGCGDSCESKFDKYDICTSAITYACDCGKGRCWHENKCLSIASYKKIFDKENEEKEKFLEAKVRERQERIKNDPTLNNYLQNLYVKKDATQNAPNQGAAAAAQPNTITQAAPQLIATQPMGGAVTQVQGVRASADSAGAGGSAATVVGNPPAADASGNQEIKVPPAFLKQEQEKQKAANSSSANGAPPALPVIPLPMQ